MSHSLMDQLKAQLLIDRNIADDDTINAMPDSGNVDAFAKRLVSAAEPTNLSLIARDGRFGSSEGIVSVVSDEADEFGGNDNNARVAARIAREETVLREESLAYAKRKAKALANPAVDVVGEQRQLDAENNANNAAVNLAEIGTVSDVVGLAGASQDGATAGQAMQSGQVFTPAAPRPTARATGGGKAVDWKPQG